MTIPDGLSDSRVRAFVRPTSGYGSICIDASSAVLGRKLVYINLYIESA